MIYEKIVLNVDETLYLETISSPDGPVQAGIRESVEDLGLNFKNEISKVGYFLKELRQGVLDTIDEIAPDQMELEVGCGFNQEVGCVILKSTVNAQVKVKMTWDIKK